MTDSSACQAVNNGILEKGFLTSIVSFIEGKSYIFRAFFSKYLNLISHSSYFLCIFIFRGALVLVVILCNSYRCLKNHHLEFCYLQGFAEPAQLHNSNVPLIERTDGQQHNGFPLEQNADWDHIILRVHCGDAFCIPIHLDTVHEKDKSEDLENKRYAQYDPDGSHQQAWITEECIHLWWYSLSS